MATLTRGWGCSRAWGCRRRARCPRCRERALPRGPSDPPPPQRNVPPQAPMRRPRRRPGRPRAVLGAPSPRAPSWAVAPRPLGDGRQRPTRRPRARALPQATPSTCCVKQRAPTNLGDYLGDYLRDLSCVGSLALLPWPPVLLPVLLPVLPARRRPTRAHAWPPSGAPSRACTRRRMHDGPTRRARPPQPPPQPLPVVCRTHFL